MKNLQEIMDEMNNLSEQIAVTLNDEEVILPESSSDESTPLALEDTSVLEDASALARNKCDYKDLDVPFCCAVNIPEPFKAVYPINPRIIYDLSCLKVIVEDCCSDIKIGDHKSGYNTLSVPVYNIRVVGCIPFVVNIPLDTDSPTTCVATRYSPSGRTVSACCSGSVCVDNVIGQVCSERAAILASGKVQLNCYTVEVKHLYVDKKDCAVIVTGKFKLPYVH